MGTIPIAGVNMVSTRNFWSFICVTSRRLAADGKPLVSRSIRKKRKYGKFHHVTYSHFLSLYCSLGAIEGWNGTDGDNFARTGP